VSAGPTPVYKTVMTLTKEITNAILSAAESSKKIINMNSSCKDWWNIFKQISVE
jgi:hypothetical protein